MKINLRTIAVSLALLSAASVAAAPAQADPGGGRGAGDEKRAGVTSSTTLYIRFRVVDYRRSFKAGAVMDYDARGRGRLGGERLYLASGPGDSKPDIYINNRRKSCSGSYVSHDYGAETFYMAIPKKCLPTGKTLRLRGHSNFDNEDDGRYASDRVTRARFALR